MKYRKKPVVIEAVQFTLEFNQYSVALEARKHIIEELKIDSEQIWLLTKGGYKLQMKTLEGYMNAKPGDWIIKGVEGEIYPCDDGIFKKTYEEYKPQEFGAADIY